MILLLLFTAVTYAVSALKVAVDGNSLLFQFGSKGLEAFDTLRPYYKNIKNIKNASEWRRI